MAIEEIEPENAAFSGRKAAKGSLTTVLSQWLKVLVQIAGLAILSRLLSPSDFGLIGIITVLVGIGQIVRDFGLSLAAIQSERLSVAERTNLFWLNLIAGSAIAGGMHLTAPFVAGFFADDRLADLTRVLALVFVVNGIGTQYRVSLIRSQRYFSLATAEVASQVLGLIAAVVAASFGMSYWSLAIQQLVISLALLVLYVSVSRWIPGWYSRKASSRSFVSFGSRLVAVQLITYVLLNVDKILVGKMYGAAQLGLYSRAYQLFGLPLSQSVAPVTNLAVHALSRVRDDRDAFISRSLQLQIFSNYVALVPLALIFGLSSPVVNLLLGSGWDQVVPYLKILALGGAFQVMGHIYYWIFVASNKTDAHLRCTILSAPVGIVAIGVGSVFSVTGIAIGVALALAFEWLVPAVWGVRQADVPWLSMMVAGLRPLFFGVVIGVVSIVGLRFVSAYPNWLQIAVAGPIAVGLCCSVFLVSRSYRHDFYLVLRSAKLMVGR